MKRLLLFAFLFVSTSTFANVVQPIGAATQVLIPAAGSTSGANGTFFRSDIAIVNLANHNQTVALQWLAQAGSGGTNTTQTITLPALSGTRSADFVNEFLHTTGLGSIVITGLTSTGAIDPTARLYVNSRIWTQQQQTGGTTSQSFPAIPTNTINTPIAALFAVGGQDNPSNYRVNIGIVNLDANPQTFIITVGGTNTAIAATIPAMSMQQISLGDGISPSTQVGIQNATASATRSNFWTAYASTIDNTTGDAWSELAVVGTP